MRRWLMLAILGAMAGLASPAGAQTRLALWRLKPLGLDAPTAERLEVLLRAEAGRIKGFSLQAASKTESILNRPELSELRACGGETDCLARIGKALGADRLITGIIGALGEDYTFDLKLVNAVTGQEERRINEALSGRVDLLIPAIRQALYKLLAPEQVTGSLRIEVALAGAEVRIDGQSRGTTPLPAPITGLRPGPHRLEIAKKGFTPFSDEVSVRFQQTTRVQVDLASSVMTGLAFENESVEPPPAVEPLILPPPPPNRVRSAAWGTLAAAAGTGLLAGFFGWRSQSAENLVAHAARNSTLDPGLDDTIARGRTYATLANVGIGIAGAAALTSLVLWIIDWSAAEDVPSPATPGSGGAVGFRF